MSKPLLHHSLVRAVETAESTDQNSPRHAALMLHGILGSGPNLRGLAQRLVQADPGLLAVLVDLRMHGRSQGFAPPHTVRACAEDLLTLQAALPCPVTQVFGHSFGGKVALAFHEHRPDLERVALLDSAPGPRASGAGSEQTFEILALLESLPSTFVSRDEFLARIHAAGHSRMIGEWLAMNLERVAPGFRLRLQLDAIRALLDDYFALDLWPVLERSEARVDVVIGGRSAVWQPDDKARFAALAGEHPSRMFMHVLPNAGHWVHAEDPDGLANALIGKN